VDKKKLAVGAAAAALLTLGGGAAIAAQNPAESIGTEGTKQEEQDPNIKGSIAAPAGNEEADGQDNETAESKQLEGLAKIDQTTAEKAALAAVPGTVKDAELGNENGFVVWEVEVQGSNSTLQEVKVDAGNGQVLAQEAEDDEGSEGPEGSEANEPPQTNEAGEATR
jgi:uncharacterized membrane protein YkoI